MSLSRDQLSLGAGHTLGLFVISSKEGFKDFYLKAKARICLICGIVARQRTLCHAVPGLDRVAVSQVCYSRTVSGCL